MGPGTRTLNLSNVLPQLVSHGATSPSSLRRRISITAAKASVWPSSWPYVPTMLRFNGWGVSEAGEWVLDLSRLTTLTTHSPPLELFRRDGQASCVLLSHLTGLAYLVHRKSL
jgi:hypothetical protein